MRIKTSSKKKQALNLNVYRNLHFRSLSAQKNKFFKIAEKLLKRIPPLGVVTLHYTIFPSSKRRLDIMNVGSIVDKYFSDAMTECGTIEDDDYTHITDVSFNFGGVVKEEYILVTITETKSKGKLPMKVLLDQNDIQIAVWDHVKNLNLPNVTGVKLQVMEDEVQAEILFSGSFIVNEEAEREIPMDTPSEATKPKRTRRTKAQIEADNAAKEAADVDETVPTGVDNDSEGDAESAGEETETTAVSESEKATTKKNLFGDKDDPSSEDDGTTEEAVNPTPEPSVKKGSIFDS